MLNLLYLLYFQHFDQSFSFSYLIGTFSAHFTHPNHRGLGPNPNITWISFWREAGQYEIREELESSKEYR